MMNILSQVICLCRHNDPAFSEYEYFLMRATHCDPKALPKSEKDDYNQRFSKGAKVVRGSYLTFENSRPTGPRDKLHFVLESDKKAMVFQESVIMRGIALENVKGSKGKDTWVLSGAMHDQIMATFNRFQQLGGDEDDVLEQEYDNEGI